MKITAVEAIVLRQPVLDDGIADGSQDDLVIRVHTDEGVVGIGEVDSAPEAVKALVDAHGGRFSVDSVEGSGTTFRIDLPGPEVEEDPRDR